MRRKVIVTHFQRRPQRGQFSIEQVFAELRTHFPADMTCRVSISRFESRGVLPRIYNMIEAFFRQGDVNHVTGDVHFLTLLLSRKKTLLTVHDCVSLERLHGMKRRIFRMLWYSLPVRRVCLVSTVSESAKAELLRHVPFARGKVHVIPDCVSGRFRKFPKELDAKRPRVLQIGTGANKNLARVAAALVGIPCTLHIVGQVAGEDESALKQAGIVYSLSIDLTDEQMLNAYRECDIVVFASTYEGFGLPIVEANAIGRPVVTSNILSMREVAGDAACLVDPFDVASIRAGLVRVINDGSYRRQLIERGYANAARFSASIVASKYALLYHKLANPGFGN